MSEVQHSVGVVWCVLWAIVISTFYCLGRFTTNCESPHQLSGHDRR